jgi:hypothetical protein
VCVITVSIGETKQGKKFASIAGNQAGINGVSFTDFLRAASDMFMLSSLIRSLAKSGLPLEIETMRA